MTLKERIEKAGLRYKKIAQELDVSSAQLSQWLSGSRPMPEHIKREIKEILDKAEKVFG